MNILGIETSCDETSAAVLHDGRVRSNIVSSQRCHSAFGGVVPELASREHERLIVSITDSAVTEANITKIELDVIAATAGPGLIGAVMVGLCFAQGMAYALEIPFVPVNHIEAHIFSPFINIPYYSTSGVKMMSGLKSGWWGGLRDMCSPKTVGHDEFYHDTQTGFRCSKAID